MAFFGLTEIKLLLSILNFPFAVTPSLHLIAVPLGFIALSVWLVKMQGDSFSTGRRTSGIQQIGRLSTGVSVVRHDVDAPSRLDHERYAWNSDQMQGGVPLGANVMYRPLGGRPMPSIDWLAQQSLKVVPLSDGDLPPIPGYAEMPAPAAPSFETVPADSGFHIAADEATKLDLEKQTVTFNGHVKLASPQFHLTSTKLVVHLGKDKKSFRLLEATGSVDVQLTGVPDDKKYRGQSGVATYDPGQGTLTLTSWPKIQGSGQELVAAEEGTRVVLIPKTGKMTTQGRAQTRIAKRLMEETPNPKGS
jgi:lipopolysaccharide transport protein LptA